MPGNDDDACWEIAEQIHRSRPQWLVMWGRSSRRFWAFPLFEMRPRMLVHADYPDALVACMDEAERRFRVWPDRREVNEGDADGK